MPTIITVDPRSGVPLYLQLIEQVKRAVALGTLAAGERLPTVKQLALDLSINPNTVARAFRDLERDAIIETSPGRGSFVRSDDAVDASKRSVETLVEKTLDDAVREAKSVGLLRSQTQALLVAALNRAYAATEKDRNV